MAAAPMLSDVLARLPSTVRVVIDHFVRRHPGCEDKPAMAFLTVLKAEAQFAELSKEAEVIRRLGTLLRDAGA